MSKLTLTALMSAIAEEVETQFDAAFAANPELEAELDRFLEAGESSCIRVVADISPRVAFRVEAIRLVRGQIEGKIVSEMIGPSRESLTDAVTSGLH
jgi:hypothetical protein